MDLRPDRLREAAGLCRQALAPASDQDWDVRAGDLDWDVRTTVGHIVDALGWYAAHLAAQSPRRLRLDVTPHRDASPAELLDVLDAAAAMLAQVARAAPTDARGYHSAGMADLTGFVAMACDEMLVHLWDAARGLGVDVEPPSELAASVVARLFPWAPKEVAPSDALLWANGRVHLPGSPRIGPDWTWHCAPLEEWDGTVPVPDPQPPGRYVRDPVTGRWRPDRDPSR